MNQSPISRAANSLEMLQRWWQTRDWKQWFQQLVPPERNQDSAPFESDGPSRPAAKSQSRIRDEFRASLASETGPTNEELDRLERGSVPSLIDVPEFVGGASFDLSVQEEAARSEEEEDLVVVETDIGHEMAVRMLHNATADD